MPLTRYYILENDTTTTGGIVQTTTNPIVFNVDGKNQSCIGDNVWCPACQSMGQIFPSGPRLSFSLGSAMPALNDDLCLCKCSPPPKLINSQTSFKEIIDDNTLAEYQQAREQYLQSKQNNLTNSQTNDDFPKFTVHFRRPDDYQGGYGFDWVRDEYLYDIQFIHESGGEDKLHKGNKKFLIDEYVYYREVGSKKLPVSHLNDIFFQEYTPSWISLFPPNKQKLPTIATLHLQIDQDSNAPLIANGIELIFECIGHIKTNHTKVELNNVLSEQGNIVNLKSQTDYPKKDITLTRHLNKKFSIEIECIGQSNEVGYVKVFAQKNGIQRQVGLLCVYPNKKIKKAVIQPLFIVTDTNKTLAPHPKNYTQDIQGQLLSQALIIADIKEVVAFHLKRKEIYIGNQKIGIIPTSHHKIIDDFLKNYPKNPIFSFNTPNGVEEIYPNAYHYNSDNLTNSLIELCKYLSINCLDNIDETVYDKQTNIIFTDYNIVNANNKMLYGKAHSQEPTDNYHNCQVNRNCNHWGNTCIIFNKDDTHTLLHELGHTFGLAHIFIPDSLKENPVHFSKGYTDNIMDYTANSSEDNPHINKMNSLFKWQWDTMRNDENLINF